MTTYAMKAHLVGVSRHPPEAYKAIAAYHRETGSLDENYITGVQKRAAAQAQPIDVVFEHYEKPGEWAALDTLADAGLRARIKRAMRNAP